MATKVEPANNGSKTSEAVKTKSKDNDPPMEQRMVRTSEYRRDELDAAVLQDEMREAMSRTEPQVPAGHVTVTVELEAALAARILSYRCPLEASATIDAEQIRRVLSNHLYNVVNETPSLSVEPFYARLEDTGVIT